MENVIASKSLNGKTIKIFRDEDTCNPRKEWDNLGTMLFVKHRRYDLGDELVDAEQIEEIANDKNNIVLPVYMYEHGGIALSTGSFNDPWDSGQIGIIYITKEKARKEFGKLTKSNIDLILANLKGEVETYNQYLSGEVYGYVIETKSGEHIDSCWGFYDTPEEIIKEQMFQLETPLVETTYSVSVLCKSALTVQIVKVFSDKVEAEELTDKLNRIFLDGSDFSAICDTVTTEVVGE